MPAFEHPREQVLDHQERRPRVGRERLLPIREVEGDDRGHGAFSALLSDDVDLAEGVDRAFGIIAITSSTTLRSQLMNTASTTRGVDRVDDVLPDRALVDDDDLSTEGRHGRGGALADAASSARHERDLPREGGRARCRACRPGPS